MASGDGTIPPSASAIANALASLPPERTHELIRLLGLDQSRAQPMNNITDGYDHDPSSSEEAGAAAGSTLNGFANAHDYEKHPVYIKLVSQQAKDAFKYVWDESIRIDKAITAKKDSPKCLPCSPPDTIDHSFFTDDLEQRFSKPPGFLALRRSFFPKQMTNVNEMRLAATKMLHGVDYKEVDVENMIRFQQELYKIINDVTSSKVSLEFHKKAGELKILFNGVQVTREAEIRKGWHTDPTIERAEQMYKLIYGMREDQVTKNKLSYGICQDLKIFMTTDHESDVTKKGNSKKLKPKTHIVREKISNVFRRLKRKLLDNAPHGISMVISDKTRETKRKKEFHTSLLTGWGEEKHMKWLEQNGRKIVPLEDSLVIPGGHSWFDSTINLPLASVANQGAKPKLSDQTQIFEYTLSSDSDEELFDWANSNSFQPSPYATLKENVQPPACKVNNTTIATNTNQAPKATLTAPASYQEVLPSVLKQVDEVSLLQRRLSDSEKNNAFLKKQVSQKTKESNETEEQLRVAQLKKATKTAFVNKKPHGENGARPKRSQANVASTAPPASKKQKSDDAKIEWHLREVDDKLRDEQKSRRPSPEAGEIEYEAMEVLDYKFSGSKLSFEVKYESTSKKFRDYSQWVTPKEALHDFADDSEENMLVKYVLIQQETDPTEGGRMVEMVKTLIRKDKKLTQKYGPYYLQEPAELSPEESCANLNHNNPLDMDVFERVPYCAYWVQGSGFLHGTKCGNCKRIISASGANKPSLNREVSVCKNMMRKKSMTACCGNVGIWCNECVQKQASASTGERPKRRGR